MREADYSRPETLGAALAGVDRLLLVSSSEVGQLVARGDLETSSADLAHLLGRPATPLAEVVRAGYDLLKVRSKRQSSDSSAPAASAAPWPGWRPTPATTLCSATAANPEPSAT